MDALVEMDGVLARDNVLESTTLGSLWSNDIVSKKQYPYEIHRQTFFLVDFVVVACSLIHKQKV
jgi:hypothetical protein